MPIGFFDLTLQAFFAPQERIYGTLLNLGGVVD
jgi:hypothetical protein